MDEIENPITERDGIALNNFDQDSDLSLNFGEVHSVDEKPNDEQIANEQSTLLIKQENNIRKRHYRQGAIDIQSQLLVAEDPDQQLERNFVVNELRQRPEEDETVIEQLAPERHVFKVPVVEPFNQEKNHFSKILIVDDNAFCLIAVVSLLAQYQLECDQAYNGQQAFEMVQSRLNKD